MPLPLEGLRVLDFSHALAGPYCTLLLAQYGATVYKIEPPDGGDIGRGWAPPFTGRQASYFLGMNAGKRGLCINLKDPRGRELCLDIADKVDILVENFRPGTLDRMGLSYAALQKRNPRLIYCSISGYGQNGPARDDSAMDLIVQASTGLISITGTAAGDQVRCGHSVADVTAGMFAMIGVLLALQARERTGAGQFVDVSMFDAMISAMASVFANFLGSGNPPRPLGTSFASIVPYRTFPTKDREVAIACGSEKLWTIFCQAMGHPELASHPDYANNALRVKNRGVLEPLLIEIFLGATSEEWKTRLNAVGVPCSPVRTIPEVTQDLHAAFRGMFPVLDHSGAGEFRVTGVPVKLSGTPGRIEAGAPLLGEHTRQSLQELLGLTPEVLAELTAASVIHHAG
ncbi:MAG TPA: CoA transferase [Bryobacteraceae bacterium]|nr:CoA transferase [Bryobacteraceae bacterium]